SAGVQLWARRYGGPGNTDDTPYSIAIDASGNVIVAGFSSDNINPVIGATIAYSNEGVPLWTNRFNGYLYKMAVDRSGNVFVTGHSDGTNSDYVAIKYSSSVPPPRLDFQKTEQRTGAELDQRRIQFANRARPHRYVHQPSRRDQSLHQCLHHLATILP